MYVMVLSSFIFFEIENKELFNDVDFIIAVDKLWYRFMEEVTIPLKEKLEKLSSISVPVGDKKALSNSLIFVGNLSAYLLNKRCLEDVSTWAFVAKDEIRNILIAKNL
jgi:hypothetical protein